MRTIKVLEIELAGHISVKSLPWYFYLYIVSYLQPIKKVIAIKLLEIHSPAVLPLIVEQQYINTIFTKGDRICIEYCHAYNHNKKISAQQETCVVMRCRSYTVESSTAEHSLLSL